MGTPAIVQSIGSSARAIRRWGRAMVLVFPIVTLLLLAGSPALGDDCNSNGIDDASDIVGGTSTDCDTNGVPDECAPVVWSLQGVLTAADASDGHGFGAVIAIDGDTAIVGVPNDDEAGLNAGAAYVFVRIGGVWIQQAKLTTADPPGGFGYAVALDGDTAIVTAPYRVNDNWILTGGAYVFVRRGGVWTQETLLLAPPNGFMGTAVAIDNDTAVVAARYEYFGTPEGPVYVFRRSGSAWALEAELYVDDLETYSALGASLALAGDTLVVGTDVFTPPEALSETPDAETARQAVEGPSWLPKGAAYVFTRGGTPQNPVWTEQAKLTASDGAAGDYFGGDVALRGDTVLVGASGQDHSGAVDPGAVYQFERVGSNWTEVAKWTAPDPTDALRFGYSIAMDGDTALVGIRGGISTYTDVGGAWVLESSIAAPGYFALSGATALVGDPWIDHAGGVDAGAVSVYQLNGDCNANGVRDDCDILGGTSADCDFSGTPDQCAYSDCNNNGVHDPCDVLAGAPDCNDDAVPDECQLGPNDCDLNGVPDDCDLADCTPGDATCADCNANGVLDACDLPGNDCNANAIPDECELGDFDCNGNNVPDACDLQTGASSDCNSNTLPDECEPECNGNGVPDACDLAAGSSADTNTNGIPDECDDCNLNGVLDNFDIAAGTSPDCNANAIPDECDTASGFAGDCNANEIPDGCDLAAGTSFDCNWNHLADPCDIAAGTSVDANHDGVPDECLLNARNVADTAQKGSLLIYPLIELRWDASGALIQDTFITLINDYPQDLRITMQLVQGDPPLAEDEVAGERAHAGNNTLQRRIFLTQNQPARWSAATGLPLGVTPFTALDPGDPPGRPDPAGGGERVLRGYLVAWAINVDGYQVRWNHLSGEATIVNYAHPSVSRYPALAFPSVTGSANGAICGGVPGELFLNGRQYAAPPAALHFDFTAAGATVLTDAGALSFDTDLVMLPPVGDFRAAGSGPVSTAAALDVWNGNAIKLTGPSRCVVGWDRQYLTEYGLPNAFLVENLGTDHGRARVNGVRDDGCSDSRAAPLIGAVVSAVHSAAGCNDTVRTLIGEGAELGVFRADVAVAPQTSPAPTASSERARGASAGSILVFPHVEVRWNAQGEPIGDTLIDLSNTGSDDVYVRMALVQGDPPLDADGGERAHPGWNWKTAQWLIAGDQPAYWSAADGAPAGVPAWTALDPGDPLGRPDPAGTSQRVLRGYLIVWAVNADGQEINWNYLMGGATVVDHATGTAWAYDAVSINAVNPGGSLAEGAQTGTPLTLNLNGSEFGYVNDLLLLKFLASGSGALGGTLAVEADMELTLLPASWDFSSGSALPAATRAGFTIWNENEVKLTGLKRCVFGWDSARAGTYGLPNFLLLENLQTDSGKAQVDGLLGAECNTNGLTATAAPLLGISVMSAQFASGQRRTAALPLVGVGTQSGTIRTGPDCNGNLIPDDVELARGDAADCNGNGTLDACDIAAGTSADADDNGTPDECVGFGDWDGDGEVDLEDFAALAGCLSGPGEAADFTPPAPQCAAAFDGDADGDVDADDFGALQQAWPAPAR